MGISKLLDLNDCNESYQSIYNEMLKITISKNPVWFRLLLKKSSLIQKYTGYNHWSRSWEYPWAYHAANFEKRCRIVDIGGGGSSFPDYLARLGHETYVIDPSLRSGLALHIDKNKSILKNLRSFIYRSLIYFLNINVIEGLPSRKKCNNPVKYYSQCAQYIEFPDNYVNRVFCLSVMEHIPQDDWKKCIQQFVRILRPGGRLIITLDMGVGQANDRLYLKLLDCCSLTLVGDPHYEVPIGHEDKEKRHPGISYETIGLVWQA